MSQKSSTVTSPVNTPSASQVQTQIERIVSSVEFRKSARMCRFLQLVTREALNGNAVTLKEYRIGTEVFDKDESFDPRVDPIVRNEARRLRRKLEIYYLVEGKSDVVLIQLPKGGYFPVFEFRNVPEGSTAATAPRRWPILALAVAVVAVAVPAWRLVVTNRTSSGADSRATSIPASRGSTPPAAAVGSYMVGRHLLFNLLPDDITASRAQLDAAIRLDPKFADAFAVLALNYQASVIFGLVSRETGIAQSRELAAKAAALSPGGAALEVALAGHLALLEEQYIESERHFERALANDPNDAAAHADYAITCLLQLGRVDEARREAHKASELDPQNGLAAYAVVLTDYCARDYQSAIAHAQKALQRQPQSPVFPPVLIDAYLASGNFDETWFFVEKYGAFADMYRALIRARKGQTSDALILARERATATKAVPAVAARLFAAGGDAVSATHWLEEADRRHDFLARIYARYAPDFDSVRTNRDFTALLAAMGKPRRP